MFLCTAVAFATKALGTAGISTQAAVGWLFVVVTGAAALVVLAGVPCEFNTQLGNGLHMPLLPQVKFRLPPVLIYPLAQLNTIKDPFRTKLVSVGNCRNDGCPLI